MVTDKFPLVFGRGLWRNGGMSMPSKIPTILLLGLSLMGVDGAAWAEGGRAYDVVFEGLPNPNQQARVEALSQTVTLKDRPPATVRQLENRAQGDVPRFLAQLSSESFFDAAVEVSVDADRSPIRVLFRLDRGPQYRIGEVEVSLPDGADTSPELDAGLASGVPATTRAILDAEERLVRRLRDQGFPFAAAAAREVIGDPEAHTVRVVYRLEPGPPASFGELRLEGGARVRAKAVQRRVPWLEGDTYSAARVEAFRKDLLGTGLFQSVRVEPGDEIGEDGTIPLTVHLTERKRRTLTLGLEYESDVGFGVNLDWEHRNVGNREIKLDVSARVTEIELAGEVNLTRTHFLRPDQSVQVSARVAEESPDAYTSVSEELSVLVLRRFSKRLRIAGGVAAKVSEVEQADDSENFALILSPWSVDYNTSDDLLNPATGGRVILEATPYTDLRSGDLTFLRSFLELRAYLSPPRQREPVLAWRGALGTISGATRNSIPADERFFAGGGGSVRGYEYQSVGPLVDGKPVGGNALVETSAEIRGRFGERWGGVLFADGGMTYDSASPRGDVSLLWGAGIGIRLFTEFGPIRVDVAVPLNPREDVDEDFQFYISLGQAF